MDCANDRFFLAHPAAATSKSEAKDGHLIESEDGQEGQAKDGKADNSGAARTRRRLHRRGEVR